MEFSLTLALPRDASSVPIARRVLRSSLGVLGVRADVVSDIEVALTEACTNVLVHAGDGDDYQVTAGIDGGLCVLTIVDRGAGFDSDARGLSHAAAHAENGRGIQLMRALVDKVTFTSRPREGTVVHLEKELAWDEDAPVRKPPDDALGPVELRR